MRYGPANINPKNIKIGHEEGFLFGLSTFSAQSAPSPSLDTEFHKDSICSGFIFEIPKNNNAKCRIELTLNKFWLTKNY